MSADRARHSRRAAPALQALAEADPAIAALALWCRHRDGEETRSSGDLIHYGPAFETLALHEQMGLAAHHVLHVALRHGARMADLSARLGPAFDRALYNLAADALVNEAVLLGDHALPRPAVRLCDLLDKALSLRLSPQEALADWDVDRLYFALTGTGENGREARRQAQSYAAAQGFAEDLDAEASAPGTPENAEAAARWRQHLARALQAGRQAGRGIGRLGHRLADIPAPRQPWELLLRRLVGAALMVAPRPSPFRPARRWIAASAEAARLGRPEPGFAPGTRLFSDMPRVVVGLDASSSIDDARLALFWAEVTGIARRLRAELHVLVLDDDIRHRQRLAPGEQRPVLPELPRGGGTAFAPVVAEALGLGASALVMLTDLEGDTGPPPPRGMRVIWAVPAPGARQPPFGRLVDMSA